jgi:hypothetical protein
MVVPTTKDAYEETLHQNPRPSTRSSIHHRIPQMGDHIVDFSFDPLTSVVESIAYMGGAYERMG